MPAWDWQSLAAGVVISKVVALPGGKPVMDDPGETPREPTTWVLPTLVTVAAAQTPKFLVDIPRASWAKVAAGPQRRAIATARRTIRDISDNGECFGWDLKKLVGIWTGYQCGMRCWWENEADWGHLLNVFPSTLKFSPSPGFTLHPFEKMNSTRVESSVDRSRLRYGAKAKHKDSLGNNLDQWS